MKRVALILICVAGLLSSLPCFAVEATPPTAHCTVSATLPLAAPAPLPSWLAPQSVQPSAALASTAIDTMLGLGITGCTFTFCEACPGESCCRTSHGCVCC